MTHPYTPTPDMLEVLAEVERNPRSILLRPNRNLGAPLNYDEQVTGNEPFMSSAERKLVRAYREEVAEFLYYRGVSVLGESDWAQARLVNIKDTLPHARAVERNRPRLKFLGKALRSSTGDPTVAFEKADSFTPLQTFQATNRLRSKDSPRIMIGCAHLALGQTLSAETILAQVLSASTDLVCRSSAALNLGLAYWQRQRFEMSAKLYKWAVQLGPECYQWLGLGLVSQAFVGDWDGAVRSEMRLADLGYHSEHPSVCFSIWQQTRGQELARSQGLIYALPSKVPPTLGELGRAILAPYLSEASEAVQYEA